MNLYAINLKKFKSIYIQIQAYNIVAVIGTYLLVATGFYIFPAYVNNNKFTLPVLFAIVVLGRFHTQYQRKQLEKLTAIEDFDTRVKEYEKFYKIRMLWFLFTCLTSCLLSILTGRYLFIYFGIFDIIITISYYPKLSMFKRELKNDDIIFY
ncbi:hypothetical protein ACI6Q2_09835 [Chitinophagaceae bacterium LWZ2-11]